MPLGFHGWLKIGDCNIRVYYHGLPRVVPVGSTIYLVFFHEFTAKDHCYMPVSTHHIVILVYG